VNSRCTELGGLSISVEDRLRHIGRVPCGVALMAGRARECVPRSFLAILSPKSNLVLFSFLLSSEISDNATYPSNFTLSITLTCASVPRKRLELVLAAEKLNFDSTGNSESQLLEVHGIPGERCGDPSRD
jgi:hypothetical protein